MSDLGYVLYLIGCFLLGLSVPDIIKKIRKRKTRRIGEQFDKQNKIIRSIKPVNFLKEYYDRIKDDRFIDIKRTYGPINSSLFEMYKKEWHEEHDGVARRERLNALIIGRDALLAEDDRNLQEKGADNFKTGLEGRWLK